MMQYPIKDKTVAIVGCGPIGLMGVDIARALGAKKIIAIEVNEYRINLAKELGADVVINPVTEDVITRVFEETNQKGVDVVAEFSGKKSAIEAAFKYIKPGGKMSMLGLGDKNIDIDFSTDIVFKGIEIYGVVGRKMFETWDQIKEFLSMNSLNLEKIVTHFYKFDEMEEAMAKMRSGNSGKVVLLLED
jgi:threonine 3-dehydrogenase